MHCICIGFGVMIFSLFNGSDALPMPSEVFWWEVCMDTLSWLRAGFQLVSLPATHIYTETNSTDFSNLFCVVGSFTFACLLMRAHRLLSE